MTEIKDKIEETINGHIYKITNLINNKSYIGRTKFNDKISRWDGTLKGARRYNNYFYYSVNKYGIENFKEEIIEDNILLNKLQERESYWIKYYNSTNPDNGYNLRSDSPYVFISDEIRRKISEALKGHTVTEETRRKIRDGNKNKIVSEETKYRISISIKKLYQKCPEIKKKISNSLKGYPSPMKGKHHTEETKRKISEGLKGRPSWNKGIKTGPVSEEIKRKISEGQKGRKQTEATKKRISNSQKERWIKRKQYNKLFCGKNE